MSDTELLREAARHIRETANAAAPGPWHMDEEQRIYADDGAYVTSPWTNDERDADLDHIALWHPGVAAAIADWLESTAIALDSHSRKVNLGLVRAETSRLLVVGPALAVARAIVLEDLNEALTKEN